MNCRSYYSSTGSWVLNFKFFRCCWCVWCTLHGLHSWKHAVVFLIERNCKDLKTHLGEWQTIVSHLSPKKAGPDDTFPRTGCANHKSMEGRPLLLFPVDWSCVFLSAVQCVWFIRQSGYGRNQANNKRWVKKYFLVCYSVTVSLSVSILQNSSQFDLTAWDRSRAL